MEQRFAGFTVTLYNEQNGRMRREETGHWGRLIERGTIAIAGFGHFAERADRGGFTSYNTSLNGNGNQYPDPNSDFLRGEDSYLLLTFRSPPREMVVEMKSLTGEVMDRKTFAPR